MEIAIGYHLENMIWIFNLTWHRLVPILVWPCHHARTEAWTLEPDRRRRAYLAVWGAKTAGLPPWRSTWVNGAWRRLPSGRAPPSAPRQWWRAYWSAVEGRRLLPGKVKMLPPLFDDVMGNDDIGDARVRHRLPVLGANVYSDGWRWKLHADGTLCGSHHGLSRYRATVEGVWSRASCTCREESTSPPPRTCLGLNSAASHPRINKLVKAIKLFFFSLVMFRRGCPSRCKFSPAAINILSIFAFIHH